jgi:DNA-binding transcriptional MocR family regulator
VNIPLNRQSSQPIYQQIHDYLNRLIQSKKLQPGQKLPSIRTLSQTLQVNKLTVIEAYSILEANGLIHARQGAGYFINHIPNSSFTLHSNFAPVQKVIISEGGGTFFEQYTASLQAQYHPGVIDFSSGFPRNPGIENLQRIAKRAMSKSMDTLFKYDFPEGQFMLRQQIAQMLLQQGFEISPDELIITNGSEQAIYLTMNYYLQPGDWVIVETPTYHGALGILENLGAKVIGIPMTAAGINLELLEVYLKSHRPKLIYTISTLHNPTGITTSVKHRRELLALAEKYKCPILEDNAYEGLNFEPVPAPIKAIDTNHLVTYVSTFSKTLMPGLRVGYMVVTGENYRHLVKQKALHDMHVSTVSQAIVSEFLASGNYRRHLNKLRTNNLQSRNSMLQAMERYFPKNITWTIPKGGFFLWVQLPDILPIQEICSEAINQKILVANGAAFFPGNGYQAIRLNFSHTQEEIEQGIAILGCLLKDYLAVNTSAFTLSSEHFSTACI